METSLADRFARGRQVSDIDITRYDENSTVRFLIDIPNVGSSSPTGAVYDLLACPHASACRRD